MPAEVKQVSVDVPAGLLAASSSSVCLTLLVFDTNRSTSHSSFRTSLFIFSQCTSVLKSQFMRAEIARCIDVLHDDGARVCSVRVGTYGRVVSAHVCVEYEYMCTSCCMTSVNIMYLE